MNLFGMVSAVITEREMAQQVVHCDDRPVRHLEPEEYEYALRGAKRGLFLIVRMPCCGRYGIACSDLIWATRDRRFPN